jgi:hypothetical protein
MAATPPTKAPLRADDASVFDRMASRGYAVRLLCGLVVALFFTNLLSPLLIIHLLSDPERVAIIDESDNIVFARLRKFSSATTLYARIGRDAVLAMFMRNPKGLDDPELLDLLFTATAQKKLAALLAEEAKFFEQYHYHQKVEMSDFVLEAEGNDQIRATTTLQLTRLGFLADRQKSEVVSAQLVLRLFRNRDIATNRRYPLAVWDFDYTPKR